MDQVLRPLVGVCVMVFIDDIIVYSKIRDHHARDIICIKAAGLKVKSTKCVFAKPSSTFGLHC